VQLVKLVSIGRLRTDRTCDATLAGGVRSTCVDTEGAGVARSSVLAAEDADGLGCVSAR
jgi:hypothetical protein